MRYLELHSHDEWSTLDGSGSALEGAQRAAELGHIGLCKTNHAVLSGVFHHVAACREVGINPLVAVECYYRPSRFPPRKDEADNWPYYHMLIIAKSDAGWRSLRLLTSEAFRSGFHAATKTHYGSLKPCVDDELLDRYHEDIIISTTCVAGYVNQMILQGRYEDAEAHMDKLDQWAGDDWYFEIQPHLFDDQVVLNPILSQYAAARGRPLVAARDAHFVSPEDHKVQEAIVLMRTKSTVQERSKAALEEAKGYDLVAMPTAYIASAQDTIDLFLRNHPSLPRLEVERAVANTAEIADRCVPFVFDRSPKLPTFKKGQSPYEDMLELRQLVMQGLREMGRDQDPEYLARVEKELAIFAERGIASFFLITHDFVDWGRSTRPLPELEGGSTVDNDPFFWATAKGGGRSHPEKIGSRGSAGGSLVLRCLKIVLINPMTWNQRFERFLNRNRKGLPDIDLDMSEETAALLEEYTKRKHGRDCVIDLIAHGTFGAKAALRRVSSVYGVPAAEYNAASKLIDDTEERLQDLVESIPELARYFERHDPNIYEIACKLQKHVQSISEHPAGVVLSDVPLEESGMPVMKKSVKDDYLVTAVGETTTTSLKSKEDVELVTGLGYMKVDFLRIVELAKHALAERTINEVFDAGLNLDELPVYDDPMAVRDSTMRRIARGKLMGVFQLSGSPGIQSFAKKVRPENLLHWAAINAIYRPATLGKGIHDQYVIRRHDPSRIEYWDPSIIPFMEETLGLLVFQEQVSDILVTLGGFDPDRADDVRKIMSKYYRAKGDLAERMLGGHRDDFVSSASSVMAGGKASAEAVWNNLSGFSSYAFNRTHASSYALVGYTDAWLADVYPMAFYAALLTFPGSKVKKPEQRKPFYERVVRQARLDGVDVLPPDVNDSEGSFTVTKDGVRFGLQGISGVGPKAVEAIMEGRPFASLEDLELRVTNKCNAGHRRALAEAGALDRFGARDGMADHEKAALEEQRLGIVLSRGDKIGPLREGLEQLCHSQAEFDDAPDNALIIVGGEVIGGEEKATRKGKALKLTLALGADEFRCSWAPWRYTDAVRAVIDADEPVIVRGAKNGRYGEVQVDEIRLAREVLEERGMIERRAVVDSSVFEAPAVDEAVFA
jgi:DNA polymerase-3 subunit alpha